MLKEFLQELCEALEIPEVPKMNEKKTYEFFPVPNVKVMMKELEPGIFIEAKLEECPKEKREDLLILLMQSNLLGQGTGGAVIGLDKEEKFLTLSLALPYEMNYQAFKDHLEEFVNYYHYWQKYIQKVKEDLLKLI